MSIDQEEGVTQMACTPGEESGPEREFLNRSVRFERDEIDLYWAFVVVICGSLVCLFLGGL